MIKTSSAASGRAALGFALAATILLSAGTAFAHGDIAPGQDPWTAWSFDPEIIVALLLAAAVYVAGLRRSPRDERRPRLWSHLAFFGGLLALFAALQSPIEPIADHVFIVHQVEHMLLRTVGPMLIMLAAPQAVLLRGLPGGVRRRLVAPLVGSPFVQAIFSVLANPAVATALFVFASYFWMIPRYHDIAILDEPIHYLWHVTLLVSGLIFFWRLLDPRPYPHGASLPTRLLMFWVAIMGNILLGAYLSFKQVVLYGAYNETGRMFGLDPLTDETFGGLTMWVPGSMMLALAGLAVVHRWARQEERTDARHARAGRAVAVAGHAFRSERRTGNKALAIGLIGFAAIVLVLAVSAAILYDHELSPS